MRVRGKSADLLLASWLMLGIASAPPPVSPPPQSSAAPGAGIVRRLRINDTLVLEVSRPRAAFTTYDHETPAWLWQRAELRGHRGYRQVLNLPRTLCTLYGTKASPKGKLLRLSFWRDLDQQLPHAQPARPLWLKRDDAFACPAWDVRYRTWSWFCDADLLPLRPRGDGQFGFRGAAYGFTGGRYESGTYYLLSYWLEHERARAQRTRQLPAPRQLAAYLALVQDSTGYLLKPPYRPLLAQLLRAYAACPQPLVTARQLAEARQVLTARNP